MLVSFGRRNADLFGSEKKGRRNLVLTSAASDVLDIGPGNAQIIEFAGGQAAQLVHGCTIAAPIAEVTDQVHLVLSL